MTTWTARLVSVTPDASGQNANVSLGITITNSLTNEVQNRTLVGSNFSVAAIKFQCEQMIAALVARDAAVALATAAIQAGGASVVLATG